MQYAALMLRRWSPAVKSELGMDGAERSGAEEGAGVKVKVTGAFPLVGRFPGIPQTHSTLVVVIGSAKSKRQCMVLLVY